MKNITVDALVMNKIWGNTDYVPRVIRLNPQAFAYYFAE